MTRYVLLLLIMVSTALPGNAELSAICLPAPDNTQAAGSKPKHSETDPYVDLNTGKMFRFMYDELNDKYERDDLLTLDLYVNTRTKDTFWLEEALLVNNAVLRDGTGIYKVDPMKVKRNGNGYKVINNKAVKAVDMEKGDKPKEGNVSSM